MIDSITVVDNPKFEIKPVSVAKATANFDVLSASVKERIASLHLEDLEVAVENIADIKAIRTALNNEKKEIEKERKMVETILFKEWNEFMVKYKSEIKGIYDNAESILKQKVDTIDQIRLNDKIKYAEDFLKLSLVTKPIPILNRLEDVKIDIQISTTEAAIRKTILAHVDSVEAAINVISTYPEENDIVELLNLFIDTRSIETAISILNSRKSKLKEVKYDTMPKEVIVTPEVKIDRFELSLTFELTESQVYKLKSILEDNGFGDYKENIKKLK